MLAAPELASSFAITIRRAHGWLELGCPNEAIEQLSELPDVLHCSKEVLRLKCKILSGAKKWAEVSEMSQSAARYYPSDPTFVEDWAWAEHKQGRTLEAYSILLEASKNLNPTWRTAYYLACFAHALKQVQEAAQWLGHAFLLHSSPADLKEQALQEEQFRS
jgi:predicted Zn-dependent protease